MISDLIYLICDRYFRKQEAESKLTTDMIILTEHLIRMLKWEDYDGNRKYMKTVVRRGGRRVFNHTVSSLFKFKKTQLHRIICEEPLGIYSGITLDFWKENTISTLRELLNPIELMKRCMKYSRKSLRFMPMRCSKLSMEIQLLIWKTSLTT